MGSPLINKHILLNISDFDMFVLFLLESEVMTVELPRTWKVFLTEPGLCIITVVNFLVQVS